MFFSILITLNQSTAPRLQQSDLPRQRGRLRLGHGRLAACRVRVGWGALRAKAHLLQGAWRARDSSLTVMDMVDRCIDVIIYRDIYIDVQK